MDIKTQEESLSAAIYVHGLASGSEAATFKKLQRKFKQYEWIAEDFGEDLAQNVKQLNEMIAKYNPEFVLGTSMGGLAVLFADAPNATKVVINPAIHIADCIRDTIGIGTHPYFCKRQDGATEFTLTEEMCRDYEFYITTHEIQLGKENYAVFALHDELLGDEASTVAQKLLAEQGYRVIIDNDGAHRVQPSTFEIIKHEVFKL